MKDASQTGLHDTTTTSSKLSKPQQHFRKFYRGCQGRDDPEFWKVHTVPYAPRTFSRTSDQPLQITSTAGAAPSGSRGAQALDAPEGWGTQRGRSSSRRPPRAAARPADQRFPAWSRSAASPRPLRDAFKATLVSVLHLPPTASTPAPVAGDPFSSEPPFHRLFLS